MLFYHIWTLPILTNIYVAKTKQRMADTHLSIETTYIAYPICYTMMLPNMPFRKADAHPLRLNTRCKDLTLVPSTIGAESYWNPVIANQCLGLCKALGFLLPLHLRPYPRSLVVERWFSDMATLTHGTSSIVNLPGWLPLKLEVQKKNT